MTRASVTACAGALLFSLVPAMAATVDQVAPEPPKGPAYVSPPSIPTVTIAVRDLPDWTPDPNLFGLEMKRREDYGFTPVVYPITPKVDSLLERRLPASPSATDSFNALVHNYAAQSTGVSPPDTTGDVGPAYFLQAVNQSVSTIEVVDKSTGANVKTFTMQSLTTASPCNQGFCDPVVLYDRMADRWLISELPSFGGNVCVYVSTSGDPTGSWYAYTFAVETSTTDYPKYGVWPQGGNGGSYLIGVNAGSGSNRDVFALDRAKMLSGQPATFQRFPVPNLPNSGFQLVLPSTVQGPNPPPDGEPAVFMRPHDDEAQDGASTPGFDLMDLWTLSVDWATPANSKLTQLPSLHIADYDMTLCGMGNTWNCMPQAGTTQKIDPIREPLHFPLQYRNFGDHQTLVGTFVEDVDGTDHAALRWFEMRKSGGGGWSVYQEGVVGGEAGVHRSVGSIAMDGSGNIALGYTRTGTSSPYFPSIYYSGRLSTDPAGTMPQGEYTIVDATTSKTNNERWGDYAGMAVDPADDCTFWFTTEYGGSGQTRVAAFKFDQCGCLAIPAASAASATAPQDNRIDLTWTDSATASITQYFVLRSTTAGGPYTQIASVPDSSPGAGGGPSYTYHDDSVSGGTRYYYVVKSNDGVSCTSPASNEASALATGQCRLAPSFAGVTAVTNPGAATCTLNIGWSAATSSCAAPVSYNVYRDTTSGFTPGPSNRIVAGVTGTSFADAVDIVNGASYFYVVRAVDAPSGTEDANVVRKSGAPTGALSTTSWTDTFEGSQSGGGFDQAGWTHNAITGGVNWVWSTAQKHDGTHSWFAADVSGVSDMALVSPSIWVVAGTTLSFYHTFKFQGSSGCFDAGTLEVSTDGGSNWTVVPDADFPAGGFTGTVSTSLSNPIGGKRAWCQGTVGTLTQVSVNLGIDPLLQNQKVQVRWHEGNDTALSSTGWYVDTVAVANAQTAGTCTMGVGTLAVSNNGPVCTQATLDLTASYTEGAVTYSWTGPSGFASTLQNPVIPNAAPSNAGTYIASVISAGLTVASNSTVAAVNAPPGGTGGLAFVDSITISWSGVAGSTGYDVVRGTLSTLLSSGSFAAATSACVANGVAGTSVSDTQIPAPGDGVWYLVRAGNACGGGTYDDGTSSQAGPRDPGVAASQNACP